MSQFRRALGAGLAVSLVATALTGCQLVDDVVDGQRVTSERLAVDSRLRQLTAAIDEIAEVESVTYGFDAADVATTANLWVEFTGTEYAAWHEAVSLVVEAGESESMSGYPIWVTLESPRVSSSFESGREVAWLDEAALTLAADAASVFPASHVAIWEAHQSSATIHAAVGGPAEELLSRITGDPIVGELDDRALAAGHFIGFSADGLEVTGIPSDSLVGWTRRVLSAEVPPLLNDVADQPQDEWVSISIGDGAAGASVSVSWAGDAEPGNGGAAWQAFTAALRGGPLVVDGECMPLGLSFNWPGVAQAASAFAGCDIPVPASAIADRPSLQLARDALAAEGIIPEDLGFQLT